MPKAELFGRVDGIEAELRVIALKIWGRPEPAFRESFAARLAASNDPTVVINGDKNVKYDSIVRVVNVLSDLKVRKVMLGTNAKKREA